MGVCGKEMPGFFLQTGFRGEFIGSPVVSGVEISV